MRRLPYACALAAIIAAGVLSRLVHTGSILVDKYLGDALYAAMVYIILRLIWTKAPVAFYACIVMLIIEAFQLTGIPARLLESDLLIVKLCARLMGTHFSVFDLIAYAVGIAGVYVIEKKI